MPELTVLKGPPAMAGTTRPLRATIGATALATGLLLTAPSPALASDMQYSQDSC